MLKIKLFYLMVFFSVLSSGARADSDSAQVSEWDAFINDPRTEATLKQIRQAGRETLDIKGLWIYSSASALAGLSVSGIATHNINFILNQYSQAQVELAKITSEITAETEIMDRRLLAEVKSQMRSMVAADEELLRPGCTRRPRISFSDDFLLDARRSGSKIRDLSQNFVAQGEVVSAAQTVTESGAVTVLKATRALGRLVFWLGVGLTAADLIDHHHQTGEWLPTVDWAWNTGTGVVGVIVAGSNPISGGLMLALGVSPAGANETRDLEAMRAKSVKDLPSILLGEGQYSHTTEAQIAYMARVNPEFRAHLGLLVSSAAQYIVARDIQAQANTQWNENYDAAGKRAEASLAKEQSKIRH